MARYVSNKYPGTCATCNAGVARMAGLYVFQGKFTYCNEHCMNTEVKYDFGDIKFDEYQQDVIDNITEGASGEHIMVMARAGSGKTTVECFGINELVEKHPELKVAVYTFGSEDGKRIKARIPRSVDGGTTHSLGSGIVRKQYRGAKMVKKKDELLADEIVGNEPKDKTMREIVLEMVGKAKADALSNESTDAEFVELIASYQIGVTADEVSNAIKLTKKMLKEARNVKKNGFDFNDMIWLPIVENMPVPEFDFVGLDEVQDFSMCQLLLIGKMIETGARVVAVGDPNQSLYAFRGARCNSFEIVRNFLNDSNRGVMDLPMPICYRCSTSVIESAQRYVEDIQARPGAPEGIINLEMPISDAIAELTSGDMVISRVNAPLAKVAFMMIMKNQKFYMRGGNQESAMLQWMVDFFSGDALGYPTSDIAVMLERAGEWLKERKGYKALEWEGRIEVLKLLAERAYDLSNLKSLVKQVFNEPKDKSDCVIISTIHRAKGSEARRVFHISPELCPHPKAETEEQVQQELNACYVAITRAAEDYIECFGDIRGDEGAEIEALIESEQQAA